MPPSPKTSTSSLSETQSNKSVTAETASDTVMAAQVRENEVNNTESMSGEPLVDVAANQTALASAESGTNDQPSTETKTNSLQTSQAANKQATNANAVTSSAISEPQAADTAAQPSAGEATSGAAEISTTASELKAAQASTTDNVQLSNGVYEAAITADGVTEDANVLDGSVDVSLNSDTEGSRGDASENKKDEKHHVRTNSVKKPTSFSKVSVSKNYLAKSATPIAVAAKPGDKPSPVGTPPQPTTAKPRLIAKTGASLRDVQKARLGTDGAGAPDASKVWNKNRPVAPPPPKQFTDEELKQQYGIHLATRLQTDENGKESKWADIDDDEDDWAPDAVVWMDGTKSTLTPQDVVPISKELKPATPKPTKPGEGVKPILAIKRQTELGPTKTILKPGASAAAAQAKQGDLPAGTSTDRPSLKAKSPAPAPSKSPWAPLPPVDKVSPINPPVQQHQPPPFVTQDARAYEQPLPPMPAREIAADTFDRSWREGEGGTRELFNSANGRYEPVTDARRGSVKPDSSARKPSVLQRPSQSGAPPAEPSAAFQTRTTGQADGSWGRRRGSSVSQGSIPPMRRMSVSKGPDLSPAPVRRTSTVIGHDMRTSPKVSRNEPAEPMFSQQSAWQQQMPARPEANAVPEEDPVKVQERIMREKRESAKKRRQEEEERAEAEKQERLKARLAQLAGAGKSRKEREAEAAATAAAVSTPTSEKPSEPSVPTSQLEHPSAQPANPAEMAAMVAPALEDQSLPPAPEEPRSMQPLPEEVLPSPLPPKPQSSVLPERPVSSTDQNQRQPSRPHLSPRANARAPFQQQSSAYRPATSSYSSPGERRPQPFERSPLPNNSSFSPWPSTAPNGNVWGSSGIGNGTFEGANVFAPMTISQQSSSLPPPPGMGRPSPSNIISPQSMTQESRSPSLQQQSVVEPHRGFAPPGFESRPDPFASQGRGNGPSPAPATGLGRPAHAPGPIAPPSRAHHQTNRPTEGPVGAWNAAADALPNQYQVDAEAAARRPRDATSAVPRDDSIKETFKQTSATQGRLGAPRRFDKTEYTIHDAQGSRSVQSLSPVPPSAQTQPSGPFSTASPLQQDPWRQAGENTVRIPDGSLNPAHGGQPIQQPPIAPPSVQQVPPSTYQGSVNFPASPLPPAPGAKDLSPPPPETSTHPVNSGDASHPLVRLPVEKPTPKVKLPPAPTQAAAPGHSQMPPQNTAMPPPRPMSSWGPPGSMRPIAMREDWQERFNGLLGRKTIQTEAPPSPPKTPPKIQGPALAVASSSRTMMDETSAGTGATVSLPQVPKLTSPHGFTIDDSDDVVSKPTIEQMFKEELSFGSAPKVAVPRNAIYNEHVYDPLPRGVFATAFNQGPSESTQSVWVFDMLSVHRIHRDGVFVHLPGGKIRKLMISNNGSRKPSGPFNRDRKTSSKFHGGKGKDVPQQVPQATHGTPNAGSRKASSHTGPTPVSDSSTTNSNPAAGAGKRSTSWAKPPKGPNRRQQQVKSNQ